MSRIPDFDAADRRAMTNSTSAQLRELILEMEADGQPRTLAQIRYEIDESGHSASSGQLAHALRHLTDKGALVKPRRGTYVISAPASTGDADEPPSAVVVELPEPAEVVEPAEELVPPDIPAPRVAARDASASRNQPAPPTPTAVSRPAARGTAFSQLVDVGSPLLWFIITGVALIVWGEVVGFIVAVVCAIAIFVFLRHRSRKRRHARLGSTSASTLDVLHHEGLSQQYHRPAKHA